MFSHQKRVLSKNIVSIPQLSVELLLISSTVIEARPKLSNAIVKSFVITTGFSDSFIVTVKEELLAFPKASTAV